MSTRHLSPSAHRRQHAHEHRYRRVRLSPASRLLYGLETLLTGCLLLAKVDELQHRADDFVFFLGDYAPTTLMNLLPMLADCPTQLAVCCLVLHMFGVQNANARVILPELLAFLGWALFLCFGLFFHGQDLLLAHVMLLCFNLCLGFLNCLAPRKRKHRQRPNTYYSAFSVASTPASQCSSNVFSTSRASLLNLSGTVGSLTANNSFGKQANNFGRRSNSATAMKQSLSFMDIDSNNDITAMTSHDDSVQLPELNALSMMEKWSTTGSTNTQKQKENGFAKEMTPFTELSGRLGGLSLDLCDSPAGGQVKSLIRAPPTLSGMLTPAALTPSRQQRAHGPFGTGSSMASKTAGWTSSVFSSSPEKRQTRSMSRNAQQQHMLQKSTGPGSLFGGMSMNTATNNLNLFNNRLDFEEHLQRPVTSAPSLSGWSDTASTVSFAPPSLKRQRGLGSNGSQSSFNSRPGHGATLLNWKTALVGGLAALGFLSLLGMAQQLLGRFLNA